MDANWSVKIQSNFGYYQSEQVMGSTRFPSHQLSNGLYVSGHPEQYKERQPTFSSSAVPYTGGDIKKSGELGKMFDIPVEPPKSRKATPAQGNYNKSAGASSNSGPLSSSGGPKSAYSTSGPLTSAGLPRQNSASAAQNRSGPLSGNIMAGSRQASHSGPLTRIDSAAGGVAKSGSTGNSQKNSGPLSGGGGTPSVARQNSGNLLPATGLITSGPITSGPLTSSGTPKKVFSGPLDAAGAPLKLISGSSSHHAVNNISQQTSAFKRGLPRVILWTIVPLFIMGFIAGGFIFATVHNAILLIVVGCLSACVMLLLSWNSYWGSSSLSDFLASYEDADLRNAKDGQYVKVTGVVTCGSVPLESSYQRVNRCIYTSTGVYEYRGLKSKPAKSGHRFFTWGLRYLERHVADFYISDFQSGLRALVKAGYGATVTPFVQESTVVDITLGNKELPVDFVRWVGDRNLSCDDRVMRLKEGYIKEGSTVTVMGVVQWQENVLMIVPPREPISAGCQWKRFIFPKIVEGLIVSCDEICRVDGIPL